MAALNEEQQVERPLIEQLKGMGWQHLPGDIDVPYLTERESFREVQAGRKGDLTGTGLKLETEVPFFELLAEEADVAVTRNHRL